MTNKEKLEQIDLKIKHARSVSVRPQTRGIFSKHRTILRGRRNLRMRRLRTCIESWPECWSGGYDPRCCRFPKSCSCTCFDDQYTTEADLESEE